MSKLDTLHQIVLDKQNAVMATADRMIRYDGQLAPTGDSHAQWFKPLARFAKSRGYSVYTISGSFLRRTHNASASIEFPAGQRTSGLIPGRAFEPLIVVANDLSLNCQIHHLTHEIGHMLTGHPYDRFLPEVTTRQAADMVAETVVESAAYLVGQTLGLDCEAHSAQYIACQLYAPSTIRHYRTLIEDTAAEILTGIGAAPAA